jgi:hypothetical protein
MTAVQFDLLIGLLCAITLISAVTLIVFLLEAGKIGQMFKEIEKFKIANNAELNSMVWHEKKLEGEGSEIILELRRTNKMLYEICGAGVSDFIQEYHDSDTFRRERTNKFKTHVDVTQEVGGATAPKAEGKTGKSSIGDFAKTPVVSRKKTNAPEIEVTQTPAISNKEKITRRAEFMKKIAAKDGHHENLVQKMLHSDA